MATPPLAADSPGARLWASLCPLLDGLALGALVEALAASGALAALGARQAPAEMAAVADQWGLKPGYLHLLLRALAHLDLTRLIGAADGRCLVEFTPGGREWLRRAAAYRGFSRRLEEAAATPAWLEGGGAAPDRPPALPALIAGDTAVDRLIARHLRGPLVAALLGACYRRCTREAPDLTPTPERLWAAAGRARDYAGALLAEQGWVDRAGGQWRITPAGALALPAAPQFFHTLSYLPTLRRSGPLLCGVDARPPAADAEGRETHLDRSLDIAFSGLVFRRTCAPRLGALLAPLFAAPAGAPRCLVDVGCGDGTLLATMGRALGQTGEVLLVGVDPAPEARARTRAVLGAAGLPHLVFAGDIAAPQCIAAELARAGQDLRAGLVVSKSVFHDRRYEPPGAAVPDPVGTPSRCLFIAEDGTRLPTREVERHLLELFGRWRPWVGAHGMVVIEAHTADPTDSAPVAGRHLLVPLEITHGLSHQYLLEAERFRALVGQAGYRAREQFDLNGWMVGRPLMTIDRYVVGS